MKKKRVSKEEKRYVSNGRKLYKESLKILEMLEKRYDWEFVQHMLVAYFGMILIREQGIKKFNAAIKDAKNFAKE